ncbi:MAG: S4 domain-containing protein, partial [Chloroflexota bacterium]|nr:S4 domain-containing protein [Chloroflexota bacterium]
MTLERLQRVMAARGASSRRDAEALILAGRVTVDGHAVDQLGTKVDAQSVDIRVDGKPLRPQRSRYILLNKPSGYITT